MSSEIRELGDQAGARTSGGSEARRGEATTTHDHGRPHKAIRLAAANNAIKIHAETAAVVLAGHVGLAGGTLMTPGRLGHRRVTA